VHTAGAWRLRASLARLAAAFGFAAVLGGAIVVALGRAALPDAAAVALVLVAAALAFEPMRHYLSVSRPSRTDVLLRRLGELPAGDLDALCARLAAWPELERLVRVRPEPTLVDAPAAIAAHLARLGKRVSRADVRTHLARARSAEERRALEQLDFLMDGHEVDHLALLDGRGEFLGVRFAMGTEPALYRPALAIIAALARTAAPETNHA
jgi:hypothetical protein